LPCAAIVKAEGEIDEGDVDTEKSDNGPSADRHKADAGGEADQAERRHQQMKITLPQTAVGRENPFKRRLDRQDLGVRDHGRRT